MMPSYSKKPKCMGSGCPGCPTCMAHGGPVRDMQKGIHKTTTQSGTSGAGFEVREANERRKTMSKEEGIERDESPAANHGARGVHARVLGEMRAMPKPKLYADGGEVEKSDLEEENAEEQRKMAEFKKNSSEMVKEDPIWAVKHPSMEDASKMADGGMVSEDEELHHAMGSELMGALERKDRKGIMSAIEAIVLSMKDKD